MSEASRKIGPEQSAEVLREASRRAADMRRIRSEIKGCLRERSATLGDLLGSRVGDPFRARLLSMTSASSIEDLDSALDGMRATDLFRGVPGFGPKRLERIIEDAGISPRRKVRGLGARQRMVIVELLEASSSR